MSGIPELVSEYSPNFRKINVNRVLGGARAGFFELDIISEQTDFLQAIRAEPLAFNRASIKRIIECKLIIDPLQTKAISIWLQKQIESYEKIFGRIPAPEEIAAKSRKDDTQ